MTTLTLNLSDEHFLFLKKASARLNIALEELVFLGVKDLVDRNQDDAKEIDETVQDAMKYVLEKNAELYKRLAV